MDDSGLFVELKRDETKKKDIFKTQLAKTRKNQIIPSSTNTTSTIAFNGISTVCVHIQFKPQFGGRLSPLQNCSGGMSWICDNIGAGGDTYEISSINEIK